MDRINTFEEDTNNENYAKDISDLSTAELADFKLAARLEAENSGLQTEDEKEALEVHRNCSSCIAFPHLSGSS